jgi:hypothetical protein
MDIPGCVVSIPPVSALIFRDKNDRNSMQNGGAVIITGVTAKRYSFFTYHSELSHRVGNHGMERARALVHEQELA